MNTSETTNRPRLPLVLAAGAWLGAALAVAGTLFVAFTGYLFAGSGPLFIGATLAMRCSTAAGERMHQAGAPEE